MKQLILLLLALMFSIPARAAPPCWTLLPSHSHLTFTGQQAGAPAHGEFQQFQVKFCFSPDSAAGDLRLTVDVASLETHNSRRDEVLKSEAFFDAQKYPQAVYEAQKFRRMDPGHYVAEGQLDLRGVTRPLPVTFSITTDGSGKNAAVQGKAVVNRFDFGVGKGRWTNTRWVGKDVQIGFALHFHQSK